MKDAFISKNMGIFSDLMVDLPFASIWQHRK